MVATQNGAPGNERFGWRNERMKTPGRRETIRRWIHGGDFVVGVDVEVVYPTTRPDEPCYEAETVKFVKEISEHAAERDIAWLQQHGEVYQRLQPASSH